MSGASGNTKPRHRLFAATGFLTRVLGGRMFIAGSALALLLFGTGTFAADGEPSLPHHYASHGGWLAYASAPADPGQVLPLGQDTGLPATAGDDLRRVRLLRLPVVAQGEHQVGNLPEPIDR